MHCIIFTYYIFCICICFCIYNMYQRHFNPYGGPEGSTANRAFVQYMETDSRKWPRVLVVYNSVNKGLCITGSTLSVSFQIITIIFIIIMHCYHCNIYYYYVSAGNLMVYDCLSLVGSV